MDVRLRFDCWSSLHTPVMGILVSPGIKVELGDEGLEVILSLNVQYAILEVLSQVNIIVAIGAD